MPATEVTLDGLEWAFVCEALRRIKEDGDDGSWFMMTHDEIDGLIERIETWQNRPTS